MAGDSVHQSDTLTVVLSDPVDMAHAPVPTNDSERLLFPQLFETLIRIDCRGEVRPQLAVSWRAEPARRVWTFTLRAGSLGSAEQAARVVSSWQDRRAAVRSIGVESAIIQADGRLSVTMQEPLDSAPRVFADPVLAAAHRGDSVPLVINGGGLLRGHNQSAVLDFRVEPDVDPRDAFDRGADLMVTRDPELIEYATRQPEYTTFPLPWNRIYVLLWPAAADSVPARLLRDAVRAEARAPEPPFWWNDLSACPERPGLSPGPTSSRVVYLRGEEVARGLAERIVALSGGGLRTGALEPAEFTASLAKGLDRAYVMALPRQTLAPCRDSAGWPRGAALQPLIDTRARVIVRRGVPPLTIDWDGTVRLAVVTGSQESP